MEKIARERDKLANICGSQRASGTHHYYEGKKIGRLMGRSRVYEDGQVKK